MTELLKVLSWDGYAISATHFIPENQNGKAMLLINDAGENQTRYAAFARFFAEQGFSVYTFDFRGIGASRIGKLSKQKADLKDWALLDLDPMIEYIQEAHKHHKLVIVAHGIGGSLAGLSRMSKRADAFLLVASQSPSNKHLRGIFTKTRYWALAHVLIPFFNATIGYVPTAKFGICDDLPKNAAAQLIDWMSRPKAILDERTSSDSGFDSMEQRTLAISFSDDPIATMKAAGELLGFFPRIRPEHWHFTPDQVVHKNVGHHGFFKKSMKSVMWIETMGWINSALTTTRNKAA